MKKFISLLVCLSMLLCMFSFVPSAGAVYHPPHTGETVSSSEYLPNSNRQIEVSYSLTCFNGWLDGTYGSDYVSASMWCNTAITCDAAISVAASYIENGSYTTESDSTSASSLGGTMSLSIYPNTDLLSDGYATFGVDHATYGYVSETLSASCPVGVK